MPKCKSMKRISRRQFIGNSLAALTFLGFSLLTRAQDQPVVRTIAGTGISGFEPEGPDGLLGVETPIDNPYGVIVGPDEALYFCEVDSGRTRRLHLRSGRLTTVAGNGEKGYSADGDLAIRASFSAPHEIRFDSSANLYVVERDSHVVRRIDRSSGVVSTLAGTGDPGFSGDGVPAALAQLRQPHSIAFDAEGNLLICDIGNGRVRLVNQESGIIITLSGTGERVPTPDQSTLSGTPLLGPRSIDTDSAGNAYLVLREGNAVFRMNIPANRLERIAGTGERGYSGDGQSAMLATFNGPKGIAYSAADNSLYIVDTENHVIRRMKLDSGIIDTVLGTGERGDGPDGDPLGCRLNRPHGVCVHNGTVFVTDSESHRIRAVSGLLA